MPETITAERTANIVAFVRKVLGDRGYKKYESNEFFYVIGNQKIEEIAQDKKNIKEDIVIKLTPNQYYYDEADIVEQLEDVIRIDKVFLRYNDNTESLPLILVTQQRFEDERKIVGADPVFVRYPELAFRYDSRKRRYYYIDENYGLYYTSPVTDATTRMIVKCSRNVLEGELMNDANNPKLARSWDKYIQAGILEMVCAGSADPNLRGQIAYWKVEFAKYKTKGVVKTKDAPEKTYKEF